MPFSNDWQVKVSSEDTVVVKGKLWVLEKKSSKVKHLIFVLSLGLLKFRSDTLDDVVNALIGGVWDLNSFAGLVSQHDHVWVDEWMYVWR